MKNTEKTATAKDVAAKSNLIKKLTLEVLNEKHNALARYIGIPCVVDASAIIEGAATADGKIKMSKRYACYRVDLQHFKGDFSKVRFRAAADGENVVFGYVVDVDGKVEYISSAVEPVVTTTTLPLTRKSKTLYATMPARNGEPEWTDVKVELFNDGLITEINGALKNLQARICELERRVEAALPAPPNYKELLSLC